MNCYVCNSFVRDGVMYFIVENDLSSKNQHGFVPRKSCVTKFLRLIGHRDIIQTVPGLDY